MLTHQTFINTTTTYEHLVHLSLIQFVTTTESGNPRGDWDPRDQPTPANEHELYMIRVLLPFMGDGTQLMVDEKSSFKLDINPG